QDRRQSPIARTSHPWLESVRRGPGDEIVVGTLLSRDRQWMIDEHVVHGGDAVLPGTGYLELARAALLETGKEGPAIEISNLLFQIPVIVRHGETQPLDLALVPNGDGFDCTWQAGEDVFATAHI